MIYEFLNSVLISLTISLIIAIILGIVSKKIPKKQKIDGKKSEFLSYYYLSLPFLFALIILWAINEFKKLPGLESELFSPGFTIGLYLVMLSSITGVASLILSNLRIKDIENELEKLKDTIYAKNINNKQEKHFLPNEEYPESRGISKELKIFTVFLILGGFVLFSAFFLNEIANENDRVSYRPWQSFHMFYSTSYHFDQLRTTVIINENGEEFVGIYYHIDRIPDGKSFVALVLPYDGKLREGDHHWISKPLSEGGTLIYKQFICKNDECTYHRYQDSYYGHYEGNDQDNLLFEINGSIDSNRSGDHSLKIPLNGAVNDEVSRFVQFDLSEKKVYAYRNGFENVTTAKFAVSLPEDITGLHILPENFNIRYENFQAFNKNKTVFEWNTPKDTASFHLDYTYPSEKTRHEKFSNLSIIFTGIGITVIITGIAEFAKGRINSKKQRIAVSNY